MLIPTRDNIRKLFETHQNQCALHDCSKKIIDSEGKIRGNIFFIESNKKDNPRFNHKLSDEQMLNYHNLILLCDAHGLKIPYDKRQYPIAELRSEIRHGLRSLSESKFEITDRMLDDILTNFIMHHDPDRLSHISLDEVSSISSCAFPHFSINVKGAWIGPPSILLPENLN
jgi:hypothetical protein